MRKTFGAARGPVPQPNAMVQRGNRPPFNQARGAPMVSRNLRPRVPDMQGTGGYRGVGPRQQTYVNQGSTQCFRCRELGHIALNCPNPPVQSLTMPVVRPPVVTNGAQMSGATETVVKGEQSRVQQAVNLKELRDVYIPI